MSGALRAGVHDQALRVICLLSGPHEGRSIGDLSTHKVRRGSPHSSLGRMGVVLPIGLESVEGMDEGWTSESRLGGADLMGRMEKGWSLWGTWWEGWTLGRECGGSPWKAEG